MTQNRYEHDPFSTVAPLPQLQRRACEHEQSFLRLVQPPLGRQVSQHRCEFHGIQIELFLHFPHMEAGS